MIEDGATLPYWLNASNTLLKKLGAWQLHTTPKLRDGTLQCLWEVIEITKRHLFRLTKDWSEDEKRKFNEDAKNAHSALEAKIDDVAAQLLQAMPAEAHSLDKDRIDYRLLQSTTRTLAGLRIDIEHWIQLLNHTTAVHGTPEPPRTYCQPAGYGEMLAADGMWDPKHGTFCVPKEAKIREASSEDPGGSESRFAHIL